MDVEEEGYFEIERRTGRSRRRCWRCWAGRRGEEAEDDPDDGGTRTVHAAWETSSSDARSGVRRRFGRDEGGGGDAGEADDGVRSRAPRAPRRRGRSRRMDARGVARRPRLGYALTKRGSGTAGWVTKARPRACERFWCLIVISIFFSERRVTSTIHTTVVPVARERVLSENFTGPPSVVLVTASTFTSHTSRSR